MPSKYFGTDGIRGKFGEQPLTKNFFKVLGASISKALLESDNLNKSILIGSDTRESSEEILNLLATGLLTTDCNIDYAGVVPTPAISLFTKERDYSIGIMISASHNLYYDNGIKIFNSQGTKISIDEENLIEDYIETIKDTKISFDKNIKINNVSKNIEDDYIKFCLDNSKDVDLKNINISLDVANGSNYKIAEIVFSKLGMNVRTHNNKPNGQNINQNCGSTFIQKFPKIVSEDKSLFGLSMDGDGDRIVIVDNNGNILDGDDILYTIVYGKLLNKEKVNGVVGTKMTNLSLEKFLNSKNIKFVRTDVGDKYVLEKMIKNNFIIGGETSGHILMLDKISSGDSIIAALAFLNYSNILKENGINHKLNKYPQTLKNIKIDKTLQENFVNVVINEAIKKYSDNNARLIIRKSGTENCIRVMVEAKNILTVESLSTEVSNYISEKLK